MGILRSDRVSGLGGANAIVGSTRFAGSGGNGSGTTVTYFKDSSLAPGTSDFCAEAWVYFNFVDNTNNTQLFANLGGNFGFANDTSWAVIRIGANNQFYGWSGSGWVAFGAGAPTVNTWHYIQLVRASNVQTLYMDGTALASTVTNSNDLTNDEVCIGGRDDGSEVIDGFVSNFRLTIGSSAAALAGVVPSAASRVLSTDTKLLCCNDPGNVNNEDAQGIPTSTTPDNDVQMIQGFASRFVPDLGEDHGTTLGDNTKFDTLSYMVPPGGTTAQSNRGRGVFGLANAPSNVNNIEYVQIQSEGNAVDFGDLITAQTAGGAGSSSTRGIFGGGQISGKSNVISYVTIATTSNATDFGDLSVVRDFVGGLSNSTRGLFLGGRTDPASADSDTVDYVTIASTGNAADFGNLQSIRHGGAGCASPTRGLFGGGSPPSGGMNTIDYFTIASAGNGTDYGDLSVARVQPASLSSSTRGIWSGGTTPSHSDVIDYVTIASTGNATDFGNLTVARRGHAAATNSLRGIFNSGEGSPANVNTIDYVTIATTGNAKDFGDCTLARLNSAGCSDSHGGIS